MFYGARDEQVHTYCNPAKMNKFRGDNPLEINKFFSNRLQDQENSLSWLGQQKGEAMAKDVEAEEFNLPMTDADRQIGLSGFPDPEPDSKSDFAASTSEQQSSA